MILIIDSLPDIYNDVPARGGDSRYFSQWRPKQLLEAGRRSDGGNGHFVKGTVLVRSVHGDAAGNSNDPSSRRERQQRECCR